MSKDHSALKNIYPCTEYAYLPNPIFKLPLKPVKNLPLGGGGGGSSTGADLTTDSTAQGMLTKVGDWGRLVSHPRQEVVDPGLSRSTSRPDMG